MPSHQTLRLQVGTPPWRGNVKVKNSVVQNLDLGIGARVKNPEVKIVHVGMPTRSVNQDLAENAKGKVEF